MNKIKYQEQFEKFMKDNPELLGGNNLGIQEYSYGIHLDTPEYSSSYVLSVYWEFCKFMDTIKLRDEKRK